MVQLITIADYFLTISVLGERHSMQADEGAIVRVQASRLDRIFRSMMARYWIYGVVATASHARWSALVRYIVPFC
jgi:hypothetical protein